MCTLHTHHHFLGQVIAADPPTQVPIVCVCEREREKREREGGYFLDIKETSLTKRSYS